MDLRHIRYFVAVAEESNFHRAAQRLNVVQSALSRRILDLEEEFGVSLFERLPRGVLLTAAGGELLIHARRILGEVEATRRHMQGLAAGTHGALRFGFSPTVSQLRTVPESLRRFRLDQPGVELQLSQMSSESQIEALRTGRIDVGLLYHLPRASPEFSYKPFMTSTFVAVLPKFHRLADKESVRLADLEGEPFVFFPREHDPVTYDAILSACAAAGLTLRVAQEARGEDDRLGLVAVGLGITLVNSSIQQRHRNLDLEIRRVVDLPVKVNLDLAWRRNDRSRLVAQFVRTFLGAAKQAQDAGKAAR